MPNQCKIVRPAGPGACFTVAARDLPVTCVLQNAPDGITIAAAAYIGPNDPNPVDITPAADGKSFQIPALPALPAGSCYTINATLSGPVTIAQVVEDCTARTILITIIGFTGNFNLGVN
jgi:hypothetical protein